MRKSRGLRRRSSVVLIAVSLVTAGLAGATARSGGEEAAADPTSARTLVGFGSPSTKGVMNALSSALLMENEAVLGSYNPSGPAPFTAVAPEDGRTCQYNSRLGNDTEALRKISFVHPSDPCYDYARVGAKLESDGTWDPTRLTFLPYATDSVTYGITGTSDLPRSLTRADLRDIFTCQWPDVVPRLPPIGSALRQIWLDYLGITQEQAAVAYCVATMGTGINEQTENATTSFTNASIAPFSIGAALSQRRGVDPTTTSNLVLGTVSDAPDPAPIVANPDHYADGVTFAITRTSNSAATMALSDLYALYTCTGADPTITPYLPAAGPVRDAWLARLGIEELSISNGEFPCIRSTRSDGSAIAQNDARFLDNNGVVPFAISSYVDQELGRTSELRGRSILGSIGHHVSAPGPTVINVDYDPQLVHRVYNVVHNDRITTSPTNEVFSGPDSLLCQATPIIERSGFVAIPDTDPNPCGTFAAAPLPNTFDAPAQSKTFAPKMSLDGGDVIGSGTRVLARRGQCKAEVGIKSDAAGTSTKLFARVTGSQCRIKISGWFYSHGGRFADTYGRTFDTVGTQWATYSHTPGLKYHGLKGKWWIYGDELLRAVFKLSDTSPGGSPTESTYTITDSVLPEIHGIEMIDPGHVGTPRLEWASYPSAPGYEIYRRNSYTNQSWQKIGETSSGSTTFYDSTALPLYRYLYKVQTFVGGETRSSSVLPVQLADPYRIKHLASLGDSYAAGEGTGSYYDDCHRSPHSYGMRLKDSADYNALSGFARYAWGRTSLFACTGAETKDVLSRRQDLQSSWTESEGNRGPAQGRVVLGGSQVNMLRASALSMPVDLVTLSIGGNDLGFSDVLKKCFHASCTSLESGIQTKIGSVGFFNSLTDTYLEVIKASRGADLVVTGYPLLFPTSGATNNCSLSTVAKTRYPSAEVTTAEMAVANRIGNSLNDKLAEAVDWVHDNVNPNISFVDLRSLFNGHSMCGSDRWINQFGEVIPHLSNAEMASAHPNQDGQWRIAQLIAQRFLGTV